MSFSNTNPPTENQQGDFPTFSNAVTVAKCFYYLSLLERFVETTKDMPEDVLKLYLVRAEYRYYKWAYSLGSAFGDIKNAIPPLDIAFFWQSHMLCPLRFFEDNIRIPQLSQYKNLRMPLKEIHEIRTGIPIPVLTAWKNVMNDEPYHLTQESLLSQNNISRYADINCIVCFVKMEIEWKDYAEWRTDQTCALQCHRCGSMFTIKHVGKANFIADLSRTRLVAGLALKNEGKNVVMSSKHLGSLGPSRRFKSMPFNAGIKSLEATINLYQAVKYEKDEDNLETRTTIVDAVQSTYLCNPYRGSSLDLIQAVARQYKFALKATQEINWDLPQGIVKGIRQYSNFLQLIKSNPKLTAVPTFEIDLAWHTHMLSPSNYREFTIGFTGKFLNHDDTIPEAQLQEYIQHTDDAWKHRSDPVIEVQTDEEKNLPSGSERKFMKKLKSIFTKQKQIEVKINPDELFNNVYNAGIFQASPTYSSSTDNKHPEQDDADYDANNASFHDRRDVKDFIQFKNSDAIMDEKFNRVKKSELGFIGTSTCGVNDDLNKWKSDSKADEKLASKSSTENTKSYSQVFASKGPKPSIMKGKLENLPEDQKNEHLKLQAMTSFETASNVTEFESFHWYNISFAWANSFDKKGFSATVLSIPEGGIGSSCGGTGISNCIASGTAHGSDGMYSLSAGMG